MTQPTTQPWHNKQKPSPVIFLTGFVELFKELAGYLLLFVVVRLVGKKSTEENNGEFFLYSFLGVLAVVLVVKFQKLMAWFYTRYWVEDNKVILTKGVFVKTRVELPIDKLQTVQIKQNLLHRLTDTCALTMDTAGNSNPEFSIEAMRLDVAMEFQQWLRAQKDEQQGAAAPEDTVQPVIPATAIRLSPAGLFKLCISENHIRSLFIILVFVMGKLNEIAQRIGLYDDERIGEQITGFSADLLSILLTLLLAIGVAVIFSSIQVVLRYFGYVLFMLPQAYQMEWGLFTRHHKTMPVARVEYITWSTNWLRERLQLFIVKLHSLTAPIATEDLNIKIPSTSRSMLHALIKPYYAHFEQSAMAIYGIRKAYIWRRTLIIGVPIVSVVMLPLWLAELSFWWLPLLWLLYFMIAQWVYVRKFRLSFKEDALHIAKGIWGAHHLIVKYKHIIHVSIHTSPWQRSNGYANLQLDLPEETWTIPYLSVADAQYIADYVLFNTEIEASK